MSQQPLTDEQIWGIPEGIDEAQRAGSDICPFKKIKCSAWNDKFGCQAENCIQEIADAQVGMKLFLEGE